MTNIFDTETPESGFRMTTLELFNWGTFDKKVWRIYPRGKNSLLTGGNGSGKTTVVDAILSLLVPPGKRYYNQSSGTDKKRDRTEETYIKGAYKTTQNEGELSAKTRYLRTTDDFSVILGVFVNQDMNETLTLAQVRWIANNNLKRWYILSPFPLSIQEHFNPLDSDGGWKKRLTENSRAEFFSSFQQYAHRFSKVFGLKSLKALTLFSQTVGIKVLGNLNEFIRTNMLEEHDVEEDFVKLRANYDNLLSSHKAIEKAKTQLELLKPVIYKGEQFEKISEELSQLEDARESLPPYFATKKKELLSLGVEENREKLKSVGEHIENIKHALSDLQREKEELIAAISRDEISEQIRSVQKEIEDMIREKDSRQNHAEVYNHLAHKLNLPRDPDEPLFRQTAARIGEEKRECEGRSDALISEWSSLQNNLEKLRTDFGEASRELESLRQRKSNIPRKNLDVRRRITEALDIPETEIPFVGELVRVKETELLWESAIERLMRNFGLDMLVSETYYKSLNQYVNHTNLYTKIVYHRVPEKIASALSVSDHPKSLIAKLEIKSDTLFYDWIARHIRKAYNYICAEELKDFERLDKALTPTGLIKNFGKHQKDDRRFVTDKANYIFGWDNAEKIRFIEKQAKDLDNQIRETEDAVYEIESKRKVLEKKKEGLIKLSHYDKFSMLDWKSLAAEIEHLKSRKRKLLESSDKLRELEEQKQEVEHDIAEKETHKEELSRDRVLIEEEIRRYNMETDENSRLLEAYAHADLTAHFAFLVPYIDRIGKSIRLDTIDRVRETVASAIEQDLKLRGDETRRAEKQVIRNMECFKYGNEEIRDKYPDWTAETINLQQDTSYLNEYRAIHDRIESEDLPRHKERFKQHMNKQMANDIINFKALFDHRVVEIKANVSEINEALKEIDYNTHPGTYIRLAEKDENDVRIRDFKEMLLKAIPDAVKFADEDEQELEFSFNNIKALTEKLSGESDWRRYVTDVRNWLKFAAEENYREDDKQKQYYEDSQSLSGGEKAKLAYTILASAIAYQFGIRQRHINLKSFRFVVVDEAFSKVDPDNALYAMELFKRLNLQLMLVTPLDKINLAEKYIHAVHYVENKFQRDSAIYDLTIEQYLQKKESFMEGQ